MGWNSWNNFGCNVDEELIRETADAMVETGMRDAGYEYVNIDDCWHGDWAVCFLNRDNNPQPITFDWVNEPVIDHAFDKKTGFQNNTYTIRDIWNKKDLGTTAGSLNAEVPGHDVLMLRLTKN